MIRRANFNNVLKSYLSINIQTIGIPQASTLAQAGWFVVVKVDPNIWGSVQRPMLPNEKYRYIYTYYYIDT